MCCDRPCLPNPKGQSFICCDKSRTCKDMDDPTKDVCCEESCNIGFFQGTEVQVCCSKDFWMTDAASGRTICCRPDRACVNPLTGSGTCCDGPGQCNSATGVCATGGTVNTLRSGECGLENWCQTSIGTPDFTCCPMPCSSAGNARQQLTGGLSVCCGKENTVMCPGPNGQCCEKRVRATGQAVCMTDGRCCSPPKTWCGTSVPLVNPNVIQTSRCCTVCGTNGR
jgi:hypothetical protein